MPSGLRKVVRSHEPVKLVDTLVVGAFIEARSCGRFEALVPHLDEELGKFYFGLLKSEARHFQGYLKLAYQYGDAKDIAQVIDKVREAERELIDRRMWSFVSTAVCRCRPELLKTLQKHETSVGKPAHEAGFAVCITRPVVGWRHNAATSIMGWQAVVMDSLGSGQSVAGGG